MEETFTTNIGVAVDFSAGSKAALRWACENIVREGDRLILVHVQPSILYEQGEMQLWEPTGSPLIPLIELSGPEMNRKFGVQPDTETIDILTAAIRSKEITAFAKIYWGDARVKICEAIEKIPLHCLVIGSRGLGPVTRLFVGSVSQYVLNTAVCPITIVKNTQQSSV